MHTLHQTAAIWDLISLQARVVPLLIANQGGTQFERRLF
jgi:hypothetical protein